MHGAPAKASEVMEVIPFRRIHITSKDCGTDCAVGWSELTQSQLEAFKCYLLRLLLILNMGRKMDIKKGFTC